MKKLRYLQILLVTFSALFLIELLFRNFSTQAVGFIDLLRSFLFCLSFSFILTTLLYGCPDRFIKISINLVIFLFAFYALFQSGIKSYYGQYFSVKFAGEGMPDITGYIVDFIKYLRPQYLLFFLISLVTVSLSFFWRIPPKQSLKKALLIGFACALALHFSAVGALFIFENKQQFESSYQLYKQPIYSQQSIYQLGLLRFLFSDLSLLFQKVNAPTVAEPTPEEPETPTDPDYTRSIDDTEWNQATANENNATVNAIDSYFLSKAITPKNEMTGKFRGKNILYIMVEAFDYIALDPTLTPTLTKLKDEGWFFNNHFSIQYNCATGESELASQTSLYPVIGTCSYSAYGETNTFTNTVYREFANAGYSTSGYHNWSDEFYARRTIVPNLGAQVYYDEATLIPSYIKGWQSDLTMMQNAMPLILSQARPFFAQIITSSTHLPYDESSALGDRYLNQINQVFPNAPIEVKRYISKAMEFDKAMEYTLQALRDSGQLENTVIILYGDHRPLKFAANGLIDYTEEVDRSLNNNLDLTPMIIYNPSLTPTVNSTLTSNMDLAPTIANLFDLNTDPRRYMGNDIFSTAGLVLWQSGSWQNEYGYYSADRSSFTPFDPNRSYDSTEINALNQRIKSMLNISAQIYKSDYYKHRTFLR